IAADPIDANVAAESGLKRNYYRAFLRQAFIPREPARIAKLVVQDEQRFAAAAANYGDFSARRADLCFARDRQDVLLGLLRACATLSRDCGRGSHRDCRRPSG